MTSTSLQIGAFGNHAVCAAAGLRDGFRAAQFYARDLAHTDQFDGVKPQEVPFVSRVVGILARSMDRFLEASAKLSIRIFLPTWRNLPSPFAAGFLQGVVGGIHDRSIIHNPLFNAYFFRAAKRILERCTGRPYLVLEHRVDAARRQLATVTRTDESKENQLARMVIELAAQRVVARAGMPAPRYRYLEGVDPNLAVAAISCIALLFADAGKPAEIMSEDDFFDVTGALAGPRLPRIAELAEARDEEGLAVELRAIRDQY